MKQIGEHRMISKHDRVVKVNNFWGNKRQVRDFNNEDKVCE